MDGRSEAPETPDFGESQVYAEPLQPIAQPFVSIYQKGDGACDEG